MVRQFLIGCLLVFSQSLLLAADPPLTWDDCLTLAARHNPDLLSALQTEEASRATYKGSYNGLLPNLTVANSYTDGSSFAATRINGVTVVSANTNNWQADATASLNIFDVAQWANIQTASAELHQAQATLRVTSSNTLLNLYTAFAGLLYAQQAIQVITEVRDLWKTNADMVTLRYKSGQESKGNMMNTSAQLFQAQTNLQQAQLNLRTAQQTLEQTLGEDAYRVIVVTGTLVADPLPSHPADWDALVDRHPKVVLQEAVLAQARAGLHSADSSLWPILSANYTKGWDGSGEFPNNPYWTATGLLSYPLFGGGPTATYYGIAAARRSVDSAEQALRSIRNQIRSGIESAWSAYSQALMQVQIDKTFLEATLQQRGEYDVEYQSGLLVFANWQPIYISLANYEQNYLQAEENAVQAEAQWKNAVGQELGANQ